MSTRALRKLQRQRQGNGQAQATSESDGYESPAPAKSLNAFQMLNAGGEEVDDDGSDHENDEVGSDSFAQKLQDSQSHPVKSKKVKKKKKKGKDKAAESGQTAEPEAQLDEIDLALQSLSAKDKQATNANTGPTVDEANAQLYRLLAIEAKHLNALNEMKRLFGNVVLEGNEEESGSQRRRGRGPRQVDLGGALTARNSPVSKGQGLKGLALKRNPFIVGKEEWPQATSGGLGMELVEKMEDGTTEYRFVHTSLYQGVQREFESCVASMDPQRLITMLIFNPYHISTLLQVSEIAKQQGDHSISGDLLERALFTFGRSAHSSFTHALSEGKARLDFRRPENREFWLAAWRYVKDLGQRGTWRTAYEWAKLILSLDPEGDPYCISNIIDQLALRGGSAEHFLKLADSSLFKDEIWTEKPNINISKAMAQYRLKMPQECRAHLAQFVQTYPWVFARLFQELNLSNLPKSIWGKQPRTDREKFEAESYVLNAKDIWSLPDAISLLVEVVETTIPATNLPSPNNHPITLDEARSTLLSGVTPLINLLPRDMTNRPSRSSDPLPPEDNLPSYDPSLPASFSSSDPELEAAYADVPPDSHDEPEDPRDRTGNDNGQDSAAPRGPNTLIALLSRMIPWINRDAETNDNFAEAVQQAGLSIDELAAQHARFQNLSDRLDGLPDESPLGEQPVEATELAAEGQMLRQMAEQIVGTGDRPDNLPQDSDEEREARLGIPMPPSPTAQADHDPDLERSRQRMDNNTRHEPVATAVTSEQDEQGRLQHWLAGAGIQGLKAYMHAHANHDRKWDTDEGERLLVEYASRFSSLRNARMRDFVLKYSLPQGTSGEVRDLVVERMGS